jgi:CxxC-x17-CxxC domain-containing protein
MAFTDKHLTCADCSADFVHSAKDQERYADLGFTNEPKRCYPCRQKRKQSKEGQNGGGRRNLPKGGPGVRETFEVMCAQCGQMARVPFKPRGDRPVYCSTCFSTRK